ncbi:MAG: DUF1598 domain-containing protein, partial [Candidatus Eisenbacteria sp.]|nr:DUF1598 domain-containing protein [Candidatus Eisenbacteria bacterium]
LSHFVDRLQQAIGPQDVVVGGVSKSSRWSRIMIFADYEMKRISQGLRDVDGVRSHLEMSLTNSMNRIAEGDTPESEGKMSRFWFHLAEDPTFLESEGILFLRNCEVVVLTERQCATADGRLFDGGGDDKCAQAWAKQFSIDRVAEDVPECAQLEALYRLLAVARAMELKGAAQQVGLDLSFLTDQYQSQSDRPLPNSLPGLANAASDQYVDDSENYIYTQAAIVCGGVSMETNVRLENILRSEKTGALLEPVRRLAMRLRPAFEFWWMANPIPNGSRLGDA